jgi:uncharacterized membrane protein
MKPLKALAVISLIPLMIFVGALISTIFLYMSWNWGMVHAVPSIAKEIDFFQTFWTAITFWTIGAAFRAPVKMKSSKED